MGCGGPAYVTAPASPGVPMYATFSSRNLTSAGTTGSGGLGSTRGTLASADTAASAASSLERSVRKCFLEDAAVARYARQASMRGSVGNYSSTSLARQTTHLGIGAYAGSNREEPGHQVTRIQRRPSTSRASATSPSLAGSDSFRLHDGEQSAGADGSEDAAEAGVILDTKPLSNLPITEWEKGGHKKNFLSSIRRARVYDVPRGNTWCAHSFHEQEASVLENHLRYVNAAEETRVNGLLSDRHERMVKHRIATARQRELFRTQREKSDEVYRRVGIQPGSKWRPHSAAPDAPRAIPLRIQERIQMDTLEGLNKEVRRTQSAREPRSLRPPDHVREVRELDRFDQKLAFLLKSTSGGGKPGGKKVVHG